MENTHYPKVACVEPLTIYPVKKHNIKPQSGGNRSREE